MLPLPVAPMLVPKKANIPSALGILVVGKPSYANHIPCNLRIAIQLYVSICGSAKRNLHNLSVSTKTNFLISAAY